MTSGADLVRAVREKARALGVPLRQFAAPLSSSVDQWLKQTELALEPKPHTVARVQALLEGRPVPPPPPNNFQKSPRRPTGVIVREMVDAASVLEPVDREPCFFCGVRADVGCKHARPQ